MRLLKEWNERAATLEPIHQKPVLFKATDDSDSGERLLLPCSWKFRRALLGTFSRHRDVLIFIYDRNLKVCSLTVLTYRSTDSLWIGPCTYQYSRCHLWVDMEEKVLVRVRGLIWCPLFFWRGHGNSTEFEEIVTSWYIDHNMQRPNDLTTRIK